MRAFLVIVTTCFFVTLTSAQESVNDQELQKRLDEYMMFNKQLNFQKLMDYIHPGLFKVVPKDKFVELFEESFDNDKMKITIDSMKISEIGPAFKHGEALYKKIDYYVSMDLKLKDTTSKDDEDLIANMITALQEGFPDHSVIYDKDRDKFIIKGSDIMFAIKDRPQAKWMFLGYQKNPEMINALYPKDVIAHFKLL
jgi:hypothetical protein